MLKSQAAKVFSMLVMAYPNAPIGDRTGELYESMLADLDFELSKQAVARLIATAKWFPTVAEIRAAVADLEHGPRRLGGEAWGDVGGEIRRVGSYGEPRFADPVTAECVRLMGWRNLCLGDNDAADRARFIELYDGLQARRREDIVAGFALPAPKQGPVLPAATRRLAAGVGRRL